MDDAFWATVNGYAMTRHSCPSSRFDGMQERYEAWEEKVTAGWEYESTRRLVGSIGMKVEDMPENLRMYLFERLLATCQGSLRSGRQDWWP
jgi:hypothetical protein